jgi:hypothetical protein
MRFVDHYLHYFGHQFITCLLSAFLHFQPLFAENSHEDQLLALPPFSGSLVGVSLSKELCWFIPGWLWERHMMLVAYLLVCQMSSKLVWIQCLVA